MASDPHARDIGEPWLLRLVLVAGACTVITLMLVLPLAVVFAEAFAKGVGYLLSVLSTPDSLAAIRLTLVIAAIVVPANTVFGVAAAWCITRYQFPGRRVLVSLIGLPFSVSPVIAGLVYVLLFGLDGWLGPFLQAHDIKIIFALPGLVLATGFVTLPFVAGQLIPLMQAQGIEQEQAALTLGASGWQIFFRITLPRIRWALLYGVLLCNARAMGEFGAVSVVSGHIRGVTNTMPLHIEILYSEYDLAAAFGVALLLSCMALLTMAAKAFLDWRDHRQFALGAQAALVAPV
jgi:sulfate transport system permease protein